jgi:Cu+-exporting ATPase
MSETVNQTAKTGRAATVTELSVEGMTCNNCARHVTEAIQSVAGVHSANVRLESNQATVRWLGSAQPDITALLKAVQDEGFQARVAEAKAAHSHDHEHEHSHDHDHGLAGWQFNLWVGLPVVLLLMAGEWGFSLAMRPWFQWVSFALASLVQVFGGAQFYRGAWSQLKVGNSNMDTLVALGSTTAFAYSVWALLSGAGGHVYFMEAASIITLISVGHWMESRVSVRASSALRSLLNLAPAMARRCGPNGGEAEVPVAELALDDRIVLRPGDRIPTDAEVTEGDSAVDESMLTGESVPVDKTAGSPVYAGTLNVNGRLVARVTATGEETALAHIILAVQRAQTSRANIQRLGDRVSSVFVPIVALIAIAAGLWWGLAPESAHRVHAWLGQFLWAAHPPVGALAASLIIGASVLIIACPCAMGLATPAAIMAGSNAAAQRGILVRDGVALEKAGQVTAVLFDKTGTLTLGRPEVAASMGLPTHPMPEKQRLATAASLAQPSGHPISQAIAKVHADRLEVSDWREVRGAGVEGRLPGSNQSARLGSLRWLREAGVGLAPSEPFVKEWSPQGATLIGLAVDQSLAAVFAVKDTVKPGAAEVVAQLNRQGLKSYLVTGDNPLTAASIARQTGIAPERVFSEVRPEQKAELVRRLQQQGERVAFVGDGINDAPALEQADLGIAVSRASDVAREAADIILLKSEIEAVPESLGLARATLRTIKQNLFWAFFYNAIGIPLAALGFMSPILCAAAMGLSDSVVIGNALRLRRWRLRK